MNINIKPKFNKIGVDKNPKKLISNIKKLKRYGWKPKTDFNLALKKYVDWFLNEKINLAFYINFNHKKWLGGLNIILNLANYLAENRKTLNHNYNIILISKDEKN